MSSTPRTTSAALVATVAVTVAALARFLVEGHEHGGARAYLLLFGALFVLRVAGQIAVIAFRPGWLPPSTEWNLLPYRLLLPTQLVLIGLIGAIVAGLIAPTGGAAEPLVVLALIYWVVMGVRYALRMTRRPDQRWFGGAIPIVFHCVLAAFLFVLGASNASAASAAPRPPVYGPPRAVLTTDISDHGSPVIEQTGDFNGDGYVDVVLVRAHWRTFETFPVQILLNNRRGAFVDATSTIFEGPPPRVQFARELVVAEFNGDGRPDIFVADHGYDAFPGPGYQNTLVLSTPSGKLWDASSNLPQRSDFTHSVACGTPTRRAPEALPTGSLRRTRQGRARQAP